VLLNLAILVVSGLSDVLGAIGRILLSYLVHMHDRLRSLRQGQVHVGPITWEVLPHLVWCGPVRIQFCSPPRRGPDAATWPTARDISQRAEPDVRPPVYAASVFIEGKACRLSIPLTGGVPIHSIGRQHAHTAACTALIITRTLPRKLPLHINTSRATDIMAPGDRTCVTCISYSRYLFHYA
jgi:hypothetical protein